MDSSYEGSDVELEGSFAQTVPASSSGSHPPSDPATIPLSRPFDGTKLSREATRSTATTMPPPLGTFHEPLVSLSFDEDEADADEEEEEDDESEEDVQLDNTPAEAAQPKHRAPPAIVARSTQASTGLPKSGWTCKECTFENNASDADQCERSTDYKKTKEVPKKNPLPDKETKRKPESQKAAVVDEPSVEAPDSDKDCERDKNDDEEEYEDDELSLDSDKEFSMPAFESVVLPETQSMMTASTTLATGDTQRSQNSVISMGKPQPPKNHKHVKSDEKRNEEGNNSPPTRVSATNASHKKANTAAHTKAKGKEKESEGEGETSDVESGISYQKSAETKDETEKRAAVQVVSSSCEFDFPPWDEVDKRAAKQTPKTDTAKKNGTPNSKATRAETDFMAYARNRKRQSEETPTKTSSTPPPKPPTKQISTESEKPTETEKSSRWIATSSKDARQTTSARRTAQRKHRVIQSSEDEEEEAKETVTRKKKDQERGEKKTKRRQAKKTTTKGNKTSPRSREQWKENSSEDESINHDHDNGTEEDEDSDGRHTNISRKGSSSSSSSKAKAATDRGERKKAKRKSREVPEEDTEMEQYTWRKIEKEMLARELEAIRPKKEDQLFRGIQFLVTGLAAEEDKENDEHSAERITRLVSDEGGKVLNNFTNASLASQCKKRSGYAGLPSTMLLSSKPRTTLKYLLSVAAGLPTIHYNWLIHCCQQRCLLPHSLYLLPAGYSVTKNCDVFITKKPRADVFESMRVEVVGSPEFKNMWKLVLKEGGAKVVERLFTPQEERVECVVSPPDPEDYLRVKFKKLTKAGVPVVGKQWVIQSLLNQRMVDVDDEVYHFENI